MIEVVILAAGEDGPTFRAERLPLHAGMDPDTVARSIAGPANGPAGLLRSISWRYEEGHVILGYVAFPDPSPAAVHQPVGDAGAAEVAADACRYLAFVMHTDTEVADALSRHEPIRRLLYSYTPATAGELA